MIGNAIVESSSVKFKKVTPKPAQKKSGSLSVTIVEGNPCNLATELLNTQATPLAVNPSFKASKCPVLLKRSTTTNMVMNPIDLGNWTMKSIEISAHGLGGIDNGCSSP